MQGNSHYLSNSELTEEINQCKYTFCEFTDPKYKRYDFIVDENGPEGIFGTTLVKTGKKDEDDNWIMEEWSVIERAKFFHAKRNKCDKDDIKISDLVFRIMCNEHIPEKPNGKAGEKVKTNFPPFKHFVITDLEKQEYEEVGRSHTKDGEYCVSHGKISDRLARMFMLLIDKYGNRYNWRGYSYLDDMKGQARLQLSKVCLMFNEAKNQERPNPFAYYTTTIQRCFSSVLKDEKKVSDLRDELLMAADRNPSNGAQLEHEQAYRDKYNSDDY